MVQLGHDIFLTQLSGLYSANQSKGTVYVTIKRCKLSRLYNGQNIADLNDRHTFGKFVKNT
jgi:hypothetical protein